FDRAAAAIEQLLAESFPPARQIDARAPAQPQQERLALLLLASDPLPAGARRLISPPCSEIALQVPSVPEGFGGSERVGGRAEAEIGLPCPVVLVVARLASRQGVIGNLVMLIARLFGHFFTRQKHLPLDLFIAGLEPAAADRLREGRAGFDGEPVER